MYALVPLEMDFEEWKFKIEIELVYGHCNHGQFTTFMDDKPLKILFWNDLQTSSINATLEDTIRDGAVP